MANFDHLALRAGLAEMEPNRVDALGPPSELIEEFYHTLPYSNPPENTLKIWRSKHLPPGGRPVIVLYDGGGHMSGSIEMETIPGRDFAETFDALVVAGNYRHAPEHPFPAGFDDAWELVLWLTKGGGAVELGGNLSASFILGGHSAGGHLAAVVSQLSLNRKLDPPFTGAFLGIPLVLSEEIVPLSYKHLWRSRAEFADGDEYNSFDVAQAMRLLGADVTSPLYSPFNVENAFVGHSPAYIQVCELDPLRDDGVVYTAALEDHGVPVRLDRTPNANHQTFCTLCDPNVDVAKLKAQAMTAMKWLLDSSSNQRE